MEKKVQELESLLPNKMKTIVRLTSKNMAKTDTAVAGWLRTWRDEVLNLNLMYNRKYKSSLKQNYKDKFDVNCRMMSIEKKRAELQGKARKYMTLFQ